MLWGGIVVIALSDAPIYMVAGALMSCYGMTLATENDYKRRLDALERHFGERIQYLERNQPARSAEYEEAIAKFQSGGRASAE